MKAQISIEGIDSIFANGFLKLANKLMQDLTEGVVIDKEKMKIDISISSAENEQQRSWWRHERLRKNLWQLPTHGRSDRATI